MPAKKTPQIKVRNRFTTERVATKVDPSSMTEQHHKDTCDINKIMARFVKTGVIDHVKTYSGQYGDVTANDFESAMNLIAEQKTIFYELPAEARAAFDNDPVQYLALMETDEGLSELQALLNPEVAQAIDEIVPQELSQEAENEKVTDETTVT